MMGDLKEHIRQRLADCSLRTLQESYTAEAAVLMSIFEREAEPHFLLTVRTQDVATHKGQISFPGGLREDTDSSLDQTALRETEEEVGISPDYVEILGRFHEYMAVTNFLVTPFVGFLKPGFSVSPNPQEVECVLEVPFQFFRETEPAREMRRRSGREITLYFYDYEGVLIWGLTAVMIKDFIEFLEGVEGV
ncbi:CoA pyrophosphatase [Acidobacteria bacterium AH-259-O06]|nr:CoA pyrophosphatase [Acidobacteria bacterium AH-259-O06]